MNGAEAAERVRSSRTALLEAVDRTRSDAKVVGDWTVREVLGHCVGWVQLLLWMLDPKHPDARSDHTGVDDFNRRAAAAVAGQQVSEVRAAFVRVTDGALALIERLSEDELKRPGRFEFDRTLDLARAVAENATGHFDEHAAQLQQQERPEA